jgi:hypothetical protein
MMWILPTALFVHLLCFGILGAAAVGGALANRALWGSLTAHPVAALELARFAMRLGRLAQMASGLTLLSGFAMLHAMNLAPWGSVWISGKLVLFFAMAAYAGIVAGRSGRRLIGLLEARAAAGSAPSGSDADLAALRARFGTFHLVMPLMLVAVVVLATYRP